MLLLFALAMMSLACASGDTEGDESEECSDNADQDRDGLFDCNDPDCAGAASCGGGDRDPDTDTDVDSDTGEMGDADTDTDSDADTDADSDTDTDVDSDTGEMGDADTDTDSDADTDADSDTDTDTDSDADADTAFSYVQYQGSAEVTAGSWEGEESIVVYDVTAAEEYCRVTNTNSGAPSAVECPECSFIFDLTWDAGTLTGDKCAGTGLSASDHDGEEWTYGFAPSFTYDGYYGTYTYTNVMIYAYAGYTIPWADAVQDGNRIDYQNAGGYAYYYL